MYGNFPCSEMDGICNLSQGFQMHCKNNLYKLGIHQAKEKKKTSKEYISKSNKRKRDHIYV